VVALANQQAQAAALEMQHQEEILLLDQVLGKELEQLLVQDLLQQMGLVLAQLQLAVAVPLEVELDKELALLIQLEVQLLLAKVLDQALQPPIQLEVQQQLDKVLDQAPRPPQLPQTIRPTSTARTCAGAHVTAMENQVITHQAT